MSSLVLQLAAPMQSWGAASRFARRTTELHPTKSGVLGLLAAAEGRRRTDPIADLMSLTFGVRVDQPGRVEKDFQTAHAEDGRPMPLSDRYYLADAVFVAAIEGDQAVLEALEAAVRRPVFPLYLGRRAFPPARPLAVGIEHGTVREVLATHPWKASAHCRRSAPGRVDVQVAVDSIPGDESTGSFTVDTCTDVPLSFDPAQRRYAMRSVTSYRVHLPNPDARTTSRAVRGHDPMDLLEEG